MSKVTIATGITRAAYLIPFDAGNLRGDYAAVCSPVSTMPQELQDAQRDRTAFYMSHTWEEGNRVNPPHAPRYYVTSYGVLIAWVTLDGQTHYAEPHATWPVMPRQQWATMLRHRDAVRAVWPERFALDSRGEVHAPFNV